MIHDWIGPALLGAGLMLANAAAAQDRQPISTSLAECAAIYGELLQLNTARRRSAEEVDLVRRGELAFAEAAVAQAASEGVPDPAGHIEALGPSLAAKWSGRFSSLWKLRENRDWIEYCGALGEAHGVLPLPSRAP